MADRKDTFLYLATCSHRSLGDFLLSRLAKHSELKRDLVLRLEEMIEQAVENRAEIYLANLLRDHGEEIISRLTSSPQTSPPQRVITSPFKPITKKRA